jgi:hypothetical protein
MQSYFTSPVRFRDVLLAKNLLTVTILFSEIAVWFWSAGAWVFQRCRCCLPLWRRWCFPSGLTLANWTSLSFPRKIEFGKMQGQRNSGMSVLVLFGVQITFGAVSALILFSGRWSGNPWLPAEVFSVLAAVALGGYFPALDAFTEFAEKKKETLLDAFCR